MARVSDYIIGAILFALVLAGLVDFMVGLNSYGGYSVNMSSNWTSFYGEVLKNSTSAYSSVSAPISEKMQGGGELITSASGDTTLNIMYNVIKMPFTSVKYIWTTITTIAAKFGLSPWAIGSIVALILVSIGFAILNALFRKDV